MITINVIEVLALVGLIAIGAGMVYGWMRLGEYLERKAQERFWK